MRREALPETRKLKALPGHIEKVLWTRNVLEALLAQRIKEAVLEDAKGIFLKERT